MMNVRNDWDSVVLAPYVKSLCKFSLEDDIWHSCSPTQISHYWSGERAPASRHAEVRLCWNDEALNVRFICEQQEPLIIAEDPVTDSKTIGLWERDVCEIFLAPDPQNPNRYFEFEAAPTGEWIDLGIFLTTSGKETEWDYTSGMKTTTKIDDKRILVAMSIPWTERIPKPKTGDEWRTNLFRCVGSDEATRYLAWRPTCTPEPNFHVPEAFGFLRFV